MLPAVERLDEFYWDEGPLMVLARHGQTLTNAARQAGQFENDRIQSKNTPLNEKGRQQAARFGRVFHMYCEHAGITIRSIHSSKMVRAVDSRDLGVVAGPLRAPRTPPTDELQELYKGNLIGERRRDVYTDEEYERLQHEDWHFRHGTKESGGETAAEAGARMKEWFTRTYRLAPKLANTAILAFTHGQVTAYGLTQLFAGNHLPDMRLSKNYRLTNGNALMVARRRGRWAVASFIANPLEDSAKS